MNEWPNKQTSYSMEHNSDNFGQAEEAKSRDKETKDSQSLAPQHFMLHIPYIQFCILQKMSTQFQVTRLGSGRTDGTKPETKVSEV